MSELQEFLQSSGGADLRRIVVEKIGAQEQATLFAAKGQTLEACRYNAGMLDGLRAVLAFLTPTK